MVHARPIRLGGAMFSLDDGQGGQRNAHKLMAPPHPPPPPHLFKHGTATK